jgi:glycosyltransferase involved in cell wall biosynthesis
LTIDESVFFQFKLDNTYKWAIVDKNHVSKLLHSTFESKFDTIFIKTSGKECIKYIGQTGTCGYATAAKGYLADYVKNNISVTWNQLKFDDSNNDLNYYVDILAESTINKKFNYYDKLILHSTPDLWESFIKKNQDISNTIGYCTWETSKLPLKWVNDINLVDEVWVPSNFNKQSFIDSGVKVEIKVVPHIWHPQKLFKKSNIKIYDFCKNEIPNDRFTFYSIGELNFRKGIEDLVEVFNKLNEKYRDTQLILKLHYKDHSRKNKEYCISKIRELTDKIGISIFVIFENLTNQQILSLHSFGDCYVSLNKGEGFGLTIFDAFNYGKKVITTGYGGQIDFLGTDYSGLVNYKIDKVSGMESFSTNYLSDQEWAYPDLDHAYDLMENCYKDKL